MWAKTPFSEMRKASFLLQPIHGKRLQPQDNEKLQMGEMHIMKITNIHEVLHIGTELMEFHNKKQERDFYKPRCRQMQFR